MPMHVERVLMCRCEVSYHTARRIANKARENLGIDDEVAWSEDLEKEALRLFESESTSSTSIFSPKPRKKAAVRMHNSPTPPMMMRGVALPKVPRRQKSSCDVIEEDDGGGKLPAGRSSSSCSESSDSSLPLTMFLRRLLPEDTPTEIVSDNASGSFAPDATSVTTYDTSTTSFDSFEESFSSASRPPFALPPVYSPRGRGAGPKQTRPTLSETGCIDTAAPKRPVRVSSFNEHY